jgi:hypothetical protein
MSKQLARDKTRQALGISDVIILLGLSNRTVLQRLGRVCVQRIRARQMSTFGNNLIDRLRTRLIDVQPEDQLGDGSITHPKNLNITAKQNGANGRSDCPVGSSLPEVS